MKFPAGGGVTVFANSGLSDPRGLAFDSADNLYVANSGTDTIEEFTPGGGGSVFAPGPDNPSLIATQTIPELSIWVMLSLGLASLLSFRRRRAETESNRQERPSRRLKEEVIRVYWRN